MEINRHTLANGLKIVHYRNKSTGNVTINMLYGVGSRNEQRHKTGLAHMLEHMMFCGSENVEDFDEPLEKIGGFSNAFTSSDITNYYITLPKENIETGFWLESDRMLNPKFSAHSFKVQKQVVLEEFKEGLNEPYGDISQLIRSLCYETHPYRHDVIGITLAQVDKLTLADVKAFFKKYYTPSNAVLSVVGDVEWKKVLALADKWFGSIAVKSKHFVAEPIPQEPEQTAAREFTRFASVPQSLIYKAYHICGCNNEDLFVCDMLSDILANGKSARLPQNLIYGKKMFTTIDSYISVNIDPGLFTIIGKISDEANINEASAAIDEQTELLMNDLVREDELEKWKNKYEMDVMAARFDLEQLAADLAFYEFVNRPDHLNQMVENYCKITADDIMRVARNIFRKQNTNTLYYLKK